MNRETMHYLRSSVSIKLKIISTLNGVVASASTLFFLSIILCVAHQANAFDIHLLDWGGLGGRIK